MPEQRFSTVCSALIYQGNKLPLKDTGEGLSLLGGHVQWDMGFPDCIKYRIAGENGIQFTPQYINGITHDVTQHGLEVLNVNVYGLVTDISESKGVHWFTTEEALREADKGNMRTPDARVLLLERYRSRKIPLSFIQVTGGITRGPQSSEVVTAGSTTAVPADHPWAPKDFIVVGGSIYHREENGPLKWGLMRCGRPQYLGKLSSFGGRPKPGDSILQTLVRETSEESGETLHIDPIGLCGIFLNPVGQYRGQPNNYAANFACVARARNKITEIPEHVKGENKEVVWKTLEELVAMRAEEFRTEDTRAAAVIAAQQRTQAGIVPFETIHRLIA